ncbi:MAG: hypothetical protein H6553_00020 [Chitinophagales bacterium]|nr:hypothetical protein [Chitinophagales bacterium]
MSKRGKQKGNRISDEQFKTLLIKELQKSDSKANLKTPFYELLSSKYAIHKKRAFDLHDKYYSEYITAKNRELERVSINAEKEVKKELILSKIDRLKIAEDIAIGNAKKIKTDDGVKIIMPTYGERLKALEYISKIEGDYVPAQLELTGKGGSDLIPNRFAIKIVKEKKK